MLEAKLFLMSVALLQTRLPLIGKQDTLTKQERLVRHQGTLFDDLGVRALIELEGSRLASWILNRLCSY